MSFCCSGNSTQPHHSCPKTLLTSWKTSDWGLANSIQMSRHIFGTSAKHGNAHTADYRTDLSRCQWVHLPDDLLLRALQRWQDVVRVELEVKHAQAGETVVARGELNWRNRPIAKQPFQRGGFEEAVRSA